MLVSHEMDDDSPSDQTAPAEQELPGCDTPTDRSCPSSPGDGPCTLMSGCWAPAIVADGPAGIARQVADAGARPAAQHDLQRPTAPEPPPPRA